MNGSITLGEQVGCLKVSEKILIKEEGGEVLYQGFVAGLEFAEIDYNWNISGLSLNVRAVQRRNQENWKDRILPQKTQQEEIPLEELPAYQLSDMDFDIRLCITVERMEKKRTVITDNPL